MARELSRARMAERSILTSHRRTLWTPFMRAIKQYQLLEKGDRVAVCVSGGKDSMLLAKLMDVLSRFSDVPFTAVNLVMDPGYSPENRARIEDNARLLELPVHVFETEIFRAADGAGEKRGDKPCYLCARMRRGHLYAKARELGCNKIALGHHLNDVIETTVMAMFYGAQLQGMMPKVKSANFPGMELIRPMYQVREEDVIAWAQENGLSFLQCACRFTERAQQAEELSKRREVKRLIAALKETNPDIEKNIMNSLHSVWVDTFPGLKYDGADHSFLERYAREKTQKEEPAWP